MLVERVSGLASSLLLLVFCCAIGAAPARADNFDYSTSFTCAGPTCTDQVIHIDADPYKGWGNFTIINLGPWGWLDFHIIIFEVGGYGSVQNIDWIDSPGFEPTSNQADLSWVINNDLPGATLDLYFNSDPVDPYEELTLNVYTDNTFDKRSRFGVIIYPTIIPEPSTALLLAAGLVGLAIHGRRRRA